MRVTAKGQITIPLAVRNQFGLAPGTEVDVIARGGEVLIRPRKDGVREWVERFAGSGTSGLTTDVINAMNRGED